MGLAAMGIRVHFDGVKAIDGVDVAIGRGEILGLIGPNGAGKTTLVNVVSGFQRPTEGRVELDGRDITRLSAAGRARLGLARTFQGGRLFPHLTVLENVQLGAVGRGDSLRAAERLAWRLLERLDLTHHAGAAAHSLPHGDERKVGIARALAARPAFLFLDEPAAGLNEGESVQLVGALREIRDEFELGVLLIEHDVALVLTLCDRVQVLDEGKTIATGSPEEVRSNERVITAYLGPQAVAGA